MQPLLHRYLCRFIAPVQKMRSLLYFSARYRESKGKGREVKKLGFCNCQIFAEIGSNLVSFAQIASPMVWEEQA